MKFDVCLLFRGESRFDSRISNFVRTFRRAGKTCIVLEGCSRDAVEERDGVTVRSFTNKRSGVAGFVEYWRKSGRIASQIAASVWWAGELYSLPIAVRRARQTGGRAAYDAREIFAHLGGLKNRPLVQWYWRMLEKRRIHRADAVVTTGEMDADFLESHYGIRRPHVVRNLPLYREPVPNSRLRGMLGIDSAVPICLYAGGLQRGRGIVAMLTMASQMPDPAFVFVGSGPLEADITAAMKQHPNIYHVPAVPNEEVVALAAGATLGFALIEPISLSYEYALPNKLFEYIMAGIPVVVADLPQMGDIVERYGVGSVVAPGSLDAALAETRRLLADRALYDSGVTNCRKAARELCWDKEEESFLAYLRRAEILKFDQ